MTTATRRSLAPRLTVTVLLLVVAALAWLVAGSPVARPDGSTKPSATPTVAAGLPSSAPSASPTSPSASQGLPSSSAGESAPGGASPAATRPAAIPDATDRAWPRNPPWDACPRPIWPGEPATGAPGNGRRVLVLGDSLTRESRVQTARLLRASGWTPTFRCWGSKRLDWGLQQLARARDLEQLPGVVVVALGTNDISWESPATTERRVRTMLDRLGPRRQVLWVDLDVDHSAFSRARADWFNRMIRSLAAKRPQLTVVDWEKKARGARAWRSDGIHYGAAGYRLRAQVVAEAVNRLGAREVPSSPSVPDSTASPIPTPPPPGVESLVDPAP